MLDRILQLLPESEATTEAISIAKGRNKYPSNFKELKMNKKLGAFKKSTNV